jgi:hypothetical protein
MRFNSLNEVMPVTSRNRNMRRITLLAHAVDQRESIFLPHLDVEQNHIRQRCVCNRHKALFQIPFKDCFVTFGLEPTLKEFAIIGIVIPHQNPLLPPVFLW